MAGSNLHGHGWNHLEVSLPMHLNAWAGMTRTFVLVGIIAQSAYT